MAFKARELAKLSVPVGLLSNIILPSETDGPPVSSAPHAARGGPDTSGVRAFIATGKQGVTYKPNTWHHGLTVLDKPGRFAVFMWRTGTGGDEEFVPVEPFTIRIP